MIPYAFSIWITLSPPEALISLVKATKLLADDHHCILMPMSVSNHLERNDWEYSDALQ